MNRREWLAMAGALGLSPALVSAVQAAEGDAKAAREAYLYALPLIEMATTRARLLKNPGAAINALAHTRTLSDHKARWVTTPNNDTLYSSAFLDLTKGPVTLTIPSLGQRYYSVAVMDMFTNNNVVLSTRTVGGEGGTFTLVGPGQASSGPNPTRIATPHAWLLIRALTDGGEDLVAAHKAQDGFSLKGPAGAPVAAYATRDAKPADYFATARALLASNPAPPTDLRILKRTAAFLGAGPFDEAAAATGVQQARMITLLAQGRQTFINGWSSPRANLGDYGQDYVYRAIVALQGLGALPVAEAMYLKAAGDDGSGTFAGEGLYRLTLPAQLPLDGFWSLSMYEATADGQFFFTDNPIHRYTIGDRTKGLQRNADGSLDIWIGRSDPGGDKTANWLPAPTAGPFALYLRAYLPKAEMLDGRFRFPAIVKV
ncbi:DUF1254 domain-containing protein [Caulobacter vibrioides]|uniref:DUF1254 domain-containing protein n=1 Tax=Caulobacter vibrioides TaxID=155892 RepID=UPI000BB46754|nr:DUF1254 domain-containing protein [Caulobacter vibrioides]ATC25506.1 DUF1254 domain-containing protein [Caulobacter vibrioides]AZH13600.1 DUF1254 domain-containing protein [Caulobacter vibrioides]PLR14466.1 DUF1254 domain-containing protein [Caulobacter vibrioides]